MKYLIVVPFLTFLVFYSCANDDDNAIPVRNSEQTFDFAEGAQGWDHGFADYPEGEEEFFKLEFEHTSLPQPLDQDQNALKLSGNNHSDDLFMYIKRQITGLEANQEYNLDYEIVFATDVPNESFGVGGSPGSSVFIKAGASAVEPDTALDGLNYYRMNIDKGNQVAEGEAMINLGDFSNGTDSFTYTLKTLKNTRPFSARTNQDGELWLIVGTDSGFEATTTIYYNTIKVQLNRSN